MTVRLLVLGLLSLAAAIWALTEFLGGICWDTETDQ